MLTTAIATAVMAVGLVGVSTPAQAAPACGVLASGASATAQSAITSGCGSLGVTYVWGGGHGATPGITNGGLDCSGFVRLAYYRATGKDVLGAGSTRDQWAKFPDARITKWSSLLPGDLVYYSSNGAASGIYHVSMYLGNNAILHAPEPGRVVSTQSQSGSGDFIGALRLYAPSAVKHDLVSDWNGDGRSDVIGVNAAGQLWVYPHTTGDSFGTPSMLRNGFIGYKHVAAADWDGNGRADIIAVHPDGSLYYFPNGDSGLGNAVQIGTSQGWGTFSHVTAADWNGDGRADIVIVNSSGQLWVYPHAAGNSLGTKFMLRNGFIDYKSVVAADWNGDGAADIIAVHPDGSLYYFLNEGGELGSAVRIGTSQGWGTWKHVFASDFTGDGKADIVGVNSGGDLYYYPHSGNSLGSSIKIGNGWGAWPHVL